MATPDEPPVMQILAGAALLKRYQHPGSWVTSEQVGSSTHRGCMLLLVEEFRLGEHAQVPPEEARLNAANVAQFLAYLKLTDNHVRIVCEPNRAPYIVVPTGDGNWDMVLDMLRNL